MFYQSTPRAVAVLGRCAEPPTQAESKEPDFVLRLADRRLIDSEDRALRLTRLEVRLLWYLGLHAGREICRNELLRHVWHYAPTAETHTVQTHIWRLRRKLAAVFPKPSLISTGRFGYALACSMRIQGHPASR